MKAIWITRHGARNVLEVRETPDPEPGRGQVRVRARVAGLNFAEVSARQGLYPDAPRPPCIVGYEGAGVVDAVGPAVTGVEEGMRVIYLTRFGGHADTVVVPAAQAIPMPDAMSFEHGAALPVNYITAYHMLFRIARIRGGEHVLVHMAAGGVGTAVLQLCRTVPGVVTYGTASSAKHGYVRDQGCMHAIDYHQDDYAEAIRGITHDRGLDLVLDPVGGASWRVGYELLRPTGMLIGFGLSSAQKGSRRSLIRALGALLRSPRFGPFKLMSDNKAVAGVNIGHLWEEQALLREELEALLALYVEGKIRPHVHATYPFSRAADAHGEIEEGKNLGKVLLAPD
jgi:NADPH:quinone reductase-like Zn-dependent oxidoreductase